MTETTLPRVLVVDDDPDLRALLADYLGVSGLTVDVAADGAEMRACMARHGPDVLVLDLMLPGEDGLTLARELRRQSDLPILMLSARGEEVDRVVGLEMGADDYMAKPFSPRELLARLRALLRRSGASSESREGAGLGTSGFGSLDSLEPGGRAFPTFGPYTLDTAALRLLRDGRDQELTGSEFNLLRAFVEHPHRVLSRDTLIQWLKGYERDAFDRSIDVRVTRLRRKIEDDPAHPLYIRTVRGEGYLFNPQGAGHAGG